MADNVTANAGSGGSTFAGASLTFSGDTAIVPLSSLGILSGSEGAWTFTLFVGGAGAVTAGVQRVTLASDDPAVASLALIKTAVETIDNAISGTEMQVDVVGPLPAGTNAIGKLAANSGVDIGDVDVASVTPGTGASSLGKAEDAAHASGDVGVMALTVRQDSAAALGGVDADYQPLITDSSGRLHVAVGNTVTVASHAVTNAGTFAVQATVAAGATTIAKAEDAASADADVGVPAMAVQKATPANTAGTDGDYEFLQMSAGRLWTSATIDAALPAGTNAIGKLASNTGVTIGAVEIAAAQTLATVTTVSTVTNVATIGTSVTPGTSAAHLGKAEDAAHASGDTGVLVLAVRSDTAAQTAGTDGDYCGLICDSAGKLHVNVGNTVTVASHAVTNAGTFATQVDGAALTALQVIDNPVLVDDTAFTPATSSVMMAGFQADEASTDSVDEGDAGAARMTLDRKVVVNPQPHTAGGLSTFRSIDLDETEEEIKASAGQLYGWYFFNASTSIRYLKFYNATAANVTVGTTTPLITIPLPAATSGGVGGQVLGTHGIAFDTAITAAVTTGLADNDTGAPSANDVILNAFYK